MVKLGTLLSAFLVLTLLILLAPVAILGPPQNVVAQPEAVTEEIEATFSFTVDDPGDWHTYVLGSGGVQPVGNERLGLVQYSRQNVELWGVGQLVPGCAFREYTTGSGTVTSTVGDLTGVLEMEWISNRFNRTYDHTPKYAETTDFGWMWGRGHFVDGDDSFAFVWIADLDCNDEMTAATGKGFMHSVEENGRFGDMGDPIENRSHIMGTLDIALSGGTYTGNFTLRNYPPNEVNDAGDLDIVGGVLQELTDDIAPQLELMNVTSDGPMDTPTDINQSPGFEEIAWGKDPIKYVVNSARLGTNGTMDLTRNTILYLNQSVIGEDTWVRIQGNPACVLHIDDTYAVTGNYEGGEGELYEILLLSIPYDMLQVTPLSPLFFDQSGYTFCPFGTVNGQPVAQTGTYAGAESFADAVIYIEATVGVADQFSYDVTYGLYAHPKISNNTIAPDKGAPGQTMNVTITGKYFLRAAGEKSGWIANSGNVSFGDNITVHSYTINNATNPLDNSITANITIDGDAPPGTRDVSVTSCFGYSGGVAAGPYKTGTKVDGFTIETPGTSLDGYVGLSGFAATNVTVRAFTNGTTTEAAKVYGATNGNGNFTVTGLPSGTYDIAVKGQTSLSNLLYGVDLSVAGTKDFGVLREGDAGSSNDDYIDGSDYGPLSSAWNSYPGIIPDTWDPDVDFSRDGYIDGSDYGPLSDGWNGWGDVFGWPGDWS